MQAASDTIVQSNAFRKQMAATLFDWEQATGMQICFRQMSRAWKLPDGDRVLDLPLSQHRSDFCETVKRRRLPACMRDDNIDLPSLFPPETAGMAPAARTRRQEPFRRLKVFASVQGQALPEGMIVRTCHAGATELLMPIWRQGVLAVVIFMGQFRLEGSRWKADAMTRPLLEALPVMDRDRLAQLAHLAVMLRAYIHEQLSVIERRRDDASAARPRAIMAFVRSHLHRGPTLAMVAAHLSLSPSRASHVVREATGQSLQKLIESQRLSVACDLLRDTPGKIDWIARQTGFNDTAYFCRYFKLKMKMTPGSYRRKQQGRIGV